MNQVLYLFVQLAFCLYFVLEQSATWSDMSDESHLSVTECSANASTDPFPAGHSNLSASLDIISASLEAAEREEEEGAQREKRLTVGGRRRP